MRLLNTFALCVLASLTFAYAQDAPAQNTIDASTQAAVAHARVRSEAMTHALAALPRECVIGDAAQANGAWSSTSRAQGEPGAQLAEVHSFDAPVRTKAFRLAVDRQGWRQLDHVDVRDADGKWQPAWAGPKPAAPARCNVVRFQQTLVRDVNVGAVRLVFRREEGEFTAGDVGVLPLAHG
jgi:hypothetical protein